MWPFAIGNSLFLDIDFANETEIEKGSEGYPATTPMPSTRGRRCSLLLLRLGRSFCRRRLTRPQCLSFLVLSGGTG